MRSGAEVEMVRVPKWPCANLGTLLAIENLTRLMSLEDTAKYSAMPASELWGIEHKHDVRVDEIYGRTHVSLASRLDVTYALAWKHGAGEPSMRRAEPGERREALQKCAVTSTGDTCRSRMSAASSEAVNSVRSVRAMRTTTPP